MSERCPSVSLADPSVSSCVVLKRQGNDVDHNAQFVDSKQASVNQWVASQWLQPSFICSHSFNYSYLSDFNKI